MRPNLARNSLLNLSGRVLPLIVAIIGLPPIVHHLGPTRFGILSIVWVVSSYAAMFDLGLGRAATKHVADVIGRGEGSAIPSIAWTAVLVQGVTGTLGACVVFIIARPLAETFLRVPPPNIPEAIRSFQLAGVAIPAVLVTSSLRGVLEAGQRFGVVNLIRSPLASANILIPLAGAVLGWTLPEIVLGLIVVSFVGVIAYYHACASAFPAIRGRIQLDTQRFLRLMRFGGWVTISSAIEPLLVYADRILLGVILSVGAAGTYAAPFEMITRASIVPAALAAAIFPAFSTLSAQRLTGAQLRIARKSLKFLLLSVGTILVIVLPLAPSLLQAWLGQGYAHAGAQAVRILAIGVFINALGFVPHALIEAQDRPDLTAKLHLMEVPLHIFTAWLLISLLGTPGAALAWTLRVTLDAIALFWIARRIIGFRFSFGADRSVWAGIVVLGSTTVALLALAAGNLRISVELLCAAIVMLACAALLWRYGLESDERHRILSLLRIRPRVNG